MILNISFTVCCASFTSIIYEILKKEGFDVRIGGNIGKPILKLEKGNDKTIYVIEVSSFQLENTKNIKPEIAVLLNISEDHLDRHNDMIEYREIKSKIFKRLFCYLNFFFWFIESF